MATSTTIEPLQKGANVSRWIQRFEASILWQSVAEEKKKYALIALLGAEAFELVADSCLPQKPVDKTYTDLLSIIKKQLVPVKLPIAARYEFYQLRQNSDDVKTYVRKLKHASEQCAFGTQLADRLRDQLVMGLSNKEAVKRMLTERLEDLTLEKAIDLATAYEAVQTTQSQLQGEGATEEICFNKAKPSRLPYKPDKQKEKCICCGKLGHIKNICYFRNEKCHNCGKIGHTKAVCHHKFGSKNTIFKRSSIRNLEDADNTLFSLGEGTFQHIVKINDQNVKMIFDTGAEISIINERVFNALNENNDLKLKERRQGIRAYGNRVIPILGETVVSVEDKCAKKRLPVIVGKGTNPCIYGCD